MKQVLCSLALVLVCGSVATADEIGFVEDFALARDRAVALRQLIPGTEDYYYYHCLHYLNSEQYAKAEEMTKPWLQRFGQTQRLTEIQTRHALLTYSRDSQKSLDFLKRQLGLQFNQQKVVPGVAPNVPTRLDPKLISRETLRAHSLLHWRNLDNFEDAALDWLAADKLDAERRRNLLQRLPRPDVPNLPELINEDLRTAFAAEFGSYPIHRQLTLAQLEELLKLRPVLLNQTAFVQIWLSKLHPGADEDWRRDPKLTRAYLDRLLAFVRKLDAAHNTLKAHVLYHRLVFDRSQGTYDKALFLEYLRLPRQQPYMAKAMLEADASRRYPADLNADFTAVTLLLPVRTDEPLVRSYLQHAHRALMHDEQRLAGHDEVLALIGCAPERVPGRLLTLLMLQGRDTIAFQVEQPERHQRRHAMVPVAVGAAIEDQELAVRQHDGRGANCLAAGTPQDWGNGCFLAGLRIQDKERPGFRMVLQMADDGGLLLVPLLGSSPRLCAFGPGIELAPVAVIDAGILTEQAAILRNPLGHVGDRIGPDNNEPTLAALHQHRIPITRRLSRERLGGPEHLPRFRIQAADA